MKLVLGAVFVPAALAASCALFRGSANKEMSPEAAYVNEFNQRVEQYVRLHRELSATVPPLPPQADAVTISVHQESLAKALREARAGVKRGELITPRVEAVFRRILWPELQDPAAKKTVKEGNPELDPEEKKRQVPLAVNVPYPKDAPLSTMPPSLLLKLPRMPDDVLEFRFVGRDLVIRDVKANIIVDYLLEAMPS